MAPTVCPKCLTAITGRMPIAGGAECCPKCAEPIRKAVRDPLPREETAEIAKSPAKFPIATPSAMSQIGSAMNLGVFIGFCIVAAGIASLTTPFYADKKTVFAMLGEWAYLWLNIGGWVAIAIGMSVASASIWMKVATLFTTGFLHDHRRP